MVLLDLAVGLVVEVLLGTRAGRIGVIALGSLLLAVIVWVAVS